MAQKFDSTSTDNLTRLVTQCTRVLHHKAHRRRLSKGTSASSSIADKTHSLHNKLRRCDFNMMGKCKQVHMLTTN